MLSLQWSSSHWQNAPMQSELYTRSHLSPNDLGKISTNWLPWSLHFSQIWTCQCHLPDSVAMLRKIWNEVHMRMIFLPWQAQNPSLTASKSDYKERTYLLLGSSGQLGGTSTTTFQCRFSAYFGEGMLHFCRYGLLQGLCWT